MPPTHRTVAQVGSANPDGVDVALTTEQTAAVQAEWDANPPPTAQQLLTRLRNRAKAALDQAEQAEMLMNRAILLAILDELNLHALKINSILDAVDGASSLAQLKTAVAAIADYPQRTPVQVRAAVKNKLDAGDADS